VHLRDHHGALARRHGNGKRKIVFRSQRKPRGTLRALVVRGIAARP
jgi:hypothetical protein